MFNKLSDKLLFDYFMIHSTRKESIYCNIPFYLSREEYEEFKESSETLNNLVFRIMNEINTTFSDFIPYIPDFKFRDEIIGLKRPMSKVFWVRYDGFLRANGGVFYSEFNYDKPCAEREILATGEMETYNNINKDYREVLKKSLKEIIKRNPKKAIYRVAALTDPCHYEETNLMYLLRKELQSENIEFVNVGPNNLYVEEGRVWAFHKSIDIILRLFPTEFSYEINNLPDILEVFEEGNVDILNDPRVIIGQCKNLYTYLWKLVKAKDIRLTEQEERAVVSTLPYTEPFNTDKLEYIIKNKDMLVLKPVYGRYSIDVFIGALHTEKEWEESVKYVEESKKDFIIQEFCQIKASDTYYTMDGKFVLPAMGFANVGCFMLNHDFAGICIRWSDDYLTSDDYTWITPVGVKSNILNIKQFEALKDRKGLWRKIAERAMFEADFTGSYAKNIEYIGLDYLTLDRNKYKELIRASEKISKLMHKTQGLIYDNLDYFADILCIEDLKSLVRYKYTEEFLFIGRMDWALDNYGNLKLLEINSETPAGILESIWVKDIISEELNIKLENPNEKLANKIAAQFYRIIEDYSKVKAVKTIGILSSTYYEDWYTAKAVLKALEGQPYEFVQGSIYDCKVAENGKLSLYGKELDAVYRYYPLDWFDKEDMSDVKEALLKTLSINPVQTIISQSKAFFAVIFELLKQGYYSDEEAEIIKIYIPMTTFDVEDLQSYDYIVKPLLSREGGGVTLACDLKEMPDEENIYQERVQTLSLDYWTHSNIKSTRETLYPIIGTYITGTEFAGIYTRLGKFITDSACVYAPVFIEN